MSRTDTDTETEPDDVAGPSEPAGPLTPYDKQLPFLTDNTRYHAFVSGIGAGKTVAGIIRMLKNVEQWNPGETGHIIAPTVPSLRNAIVPELHKWGIIDRCEYNRSENWLEFPNGSKVILESADNDRKIERLRGPSISWFWMDEAATIDKRAWDIMIGRLRAGAYRNAFITTTPKGYNWVYDRFADADDVTQVFGVPSMANVHLPDDYEQIITEYEGRYYEQEAQGQFVQFEGLVYNWFDDSHLTDEAPGTYDEVIYGVDWGHNNPAVVVAIARTGETWTVVDEWYERRCTVNDQARAAEALVEQYGEGPIYCDPSEPANIETFTRSGLPAEGADNDVTPGIQHVTSLGQTDSLEVVTACQNLRNEFNSYKYKDDGESEQPLKQHDHALDSLRYALFTHSRPKVASGTGVW